MNYLNVALVARDVLAIQSSSACSEGCFSVSGNLIDELLTMLETSLFDPSSFFVRRIIYLVPKGRLMWILSVPRDLST